mgnify:FL=1
MKTSWGKIFLIVFIITILYIFAITFEFYKTKIVWVDNLQHILAGIAVAMFSILIKRDNNKKINIAIWIIGFVLIITVFWEIMEFLLWKLLPFYAQKFSLFSPTILEAFEDIISNLIGGLIFTILYTNKIKK